MVGWVGWARGGVQKRHARKHKRPSSDLWDEAGSRTAKKERHRSRFRLKWEHAFVGRGVELFDLGSPAKCRQA